MLTNQAPPVDVFDASQVRLSEIGAAYDVAMRQGNAPVASRLLLSALDLVLGNEQADSSVNDAPGADATIICAYLQETYGLLVVPTDPFLRPLLPPIPDTGASLRRLVLAVNGRAIVANASLIGMGATLVPLAVMPILPSSATQVMPSQLPHQFA